MPIFTLFRVYGKSCKKYGYFSKNLGFRKFEVFEKSSKTVNFAKYVGNRHISCKILQVAIFHFPRFLGKSHKVASKFSEKKQFCGEICEENGPFLTQKSPFFRTLAKMAKILKTGDSGVLLKTGTVFRCPILPVWALSSKLEKGDKKYPPKT